MKYQTLRNFLLLLAHPISILVMIVLFVNDHILRINWPSWWTGKIGDFAWLFFAPFALAALISLFFPTRSPLEKQIGTVAFVLTAGIFIMAKIVPAANAFLVHQTSWLLGIPIRITLDPSDLVALIVLPFSFWFWRRTKRVEVQFPKRAWVVLPFAALLTIANSSGPDYGIDCLSLSGDNIEAYSTYFTYISDDGGFTWEESDRFNYECEKHTSENTIFDSLNPNVSYHYVPGSVIEISRDNGKSWQIDYLLSSIKSARAAYYQKFRNGSPVFEPGPLDAIIDPKSGNIVFAMGHEGVLVRQSNGSWHWITLGLYKREDITRFDVFLPLLAGEIWLGIFLGFLLLCTCVLIMKHNWIKIIGLLLNWLIWIFSAFIMHPALMAKPYGGTISNMVLIAMGIFLLIISYFILRDYKVFPRETLLRLIGQSFLAGILFFLPYFLWIYDILKSYSVAMVFAIIFSVVILLLQLYSIKTMNKSQNKTARV